MVLRYPFVMRAGHRYASPEFRELARAANATGMNAATLCDRREQCSPEAERIAMSGRLLAVVLAPGPREAVAALMEAAPLLVDPDEAIAMVGLFGPAVAAVAAELRAAADAIEAEAKAHGLS